MIRKAQFEGRFYPDSREAVVELIDSLIKEARYPDFHLPLNKVIGAILPHAGHIYSGYQTLPFFKYLKKSVIQPDTFIIINPNHTGIGPSISLDPSDSWKNSLGLIEIDKELNEHLPYPQDSNAQEGEHSAEVIVPFIQYFYPKQDRKILPLCIRHINSETAKKIAKDLDRAIKQCNRKVIIIASSDFSHFLTAQEGFKEDQKLLKMLEKRDTNGVEQAVIKNRLTVCGYGPIMVLMAYAELVDKKYLSSILARGHSGEVHYSQEVVDYISLLFYN